MSEVFWEFGSNPELECHPERGGIEVKNEARSLGMTRVFQKSGTEGYIEGQDRVK